MATKEQTENQVGSLLKELDGIESEYGFHIPDWLPEASSTGLRWMRSRLWEGFHVAYQIDHVGKRVLFKTWEYGEDEPIWESRTA